MPELVRPARGLLVTAAFAACALDLLNVWVWRTSSDPSSALVQQMTLAWLALGIIELVALGLMVVAKQRWSLPVLIYAAVLFAVDRLIFQDGERTARLPELALLAWNLAWLLQGLLTVVVARGSAPSWLGAILGARFAWTVILSVAHGRIGTLDWFANMLLQQTLPSLIAQAAVIAALLLPREDQEARVAAPATRGNDVLVGALWLGAGVVATMFSLMAAPGGRSIVFTGAIVYGLVKIVRGLGAKPAAD